MVVALMIYLHYTFELCQKKYENVFNNLHFSLLLKPLFYLAVWAAYFCVMSSFADLCFDILYVHIYCSALHMCLDSFVQLLLALKQIILSKIRLVSYIRLF